MRRLELARLPAEAPASAQPHKPKWTFGNSPQLALSIAGSEDYANRVLKRIRGGVGRYGLWPAGSRQGARGGVSPNPFSPDACA